MPPKQATTSRLTYLLEIPVLFLRAFPFSLSITWRYLLVLPVLIVVLAVFVLMSFLFAYAFGLFSPFIGVLFAFAFGVASGVVPVMAGMRVGLQSYQVRPRNGFLGLIVPAVGYGFLEGLCILVLMALGFGAFVLLTPLSPQALLTTASTDEAISVVGMLEANSGIAITLFVIIACLAICLRTALLVPLAGASVGADPDGRRHTPFYGFGDGFGSILALVLVSSIGLSIAMPLAVYLVGLFGVIDGLTATFAEIRSAEEPEGIRAILRFGTDGLILIGVWMLISLFFFSLQCAGAVLAFMRHVDAMKPAVQEVAPVEEEEKEPEPQVDHTDLLALMRSRMPVKED
jgi:hypothetical protein